VVLLWNIQSVVLACSVVATPPGVSWEGLSSFLCRSGLPNCKVAWVMSEKEYDVRVEGKVQETMSGVLSRRQVT